jgi:tryptophan synthase alpha chain
MSKIDDLFVRLRTAGQQALMPFVAAGDPDLDFTIESIKALDQHGASLIEVGIPYSDPIADGPVIQAAYSRALDKKFKVCDLMSRLGKISSEIKAPLVAMVSFATVLKHGVIPFVEEATRAGLSGLIVPDLPFDESTDLKAQCDAKGLSLVQLITPTTERERAKQIANAASGFIYYVSVAGITGARRELPADLVQNVKWLRSQTKTPVCIGFGISLPDHVRQLAPIADGLIVGSALVKHLENAATLGRDAVLKSMLASFDGLRDALAHPVS